MSAVRSARQPGEAWIGGWCALSDPWVAEVLARSGFDWLCLDAQHGTHEDRSLVRTLGFQASRTPVLVRVRGNDAGLIGRALDAGAAGVIVPMVGDALEAAEAVAASRYPPRGTRSWGPLAGLTGRTPTGPTEANPACVVMVETPAAVRAVTEIAGVPGVDAVFVGPYDLALASGASLDELLTGAPGREALKRVVTACREHDIVAGAYAGSPRTAKLLKELGFTMIAVASDSALLQEAALGAVAAARHALGEPATFVSSEGSAA